MLNAHFTDDELDCLISTAGDLWADLNLDNLSTRQLQLAARAHGLCIRLAENDPPATDPTPSDDTDRLPGQ